MFYRGSRYEAVADATRDTADGRTIRYKRTRFIPETAEMFSHKLAQGERLDLVAWRFYRDPEQFWRICDANRALRPRDLEETARRLSIPMPS